ncbi:MAG TPA: ATP-binding protein, partial [Spirochaetota bacterium]|nr:ATP-binding protein [Spirochaetota bacterium]
GAGLGLSVAYFIIVTNHKGSIEVDSEPGVGTTFTISLPLLSEDME